MKKIILISLLSLFLMNCGSSDDGKNFSHKDITFSEELKKKGYEVIDFSAKSTIDDAARCYLIINKPLKPYKDKITFYDISGRELIIQEIESQLRDREGLSNYSNPSYLYYFRLGYSDFSLVDKIIISKK